MKSLNEYTQDCEIMNELDIHGQLYSIVVLGVMNPLIHHPSWYRMQGLITEEQEKVFLESRKIICLPQISQMNCAEFSVACEQERWMVRTNDQAQINTLVDIASRIFDGSLLTHTPIRAFGINADFDVQTSATNVGDVVGRFSSAAGLVIPENTEVSGFLQTVWRTDNGENKVSVKPSTQGSEFVLVENNFHFETPKEEFDLGALIKANFDKCLERARSNAEQIASKISAGVQ